MPTFYQFYKCAQPPHDQFNPEKSVLAADTAFLLLQPVALARLASSLEFIPYEQACVEVCTMHFVYSSFHLLWCCSALCLWNYLLASVASSLAAILSPSVQLPGDKIGISFLICNYYK